MHVQTRLPPHRLTSLLDWLLRFIDSLSRVELVFMTHRGSILLPVDMRLLVASSCHVRLGADPGYIDVLIGDSLEL